MRTIIVLLSAEELIGNHSKDGKRRHECGTLHHWLCALNSVALRISIEALHFLDYCNSLEVCKCKCNGQGLFMAGFMISMIFGSNMQRHYMSSMKSSALFLANEKLRLEQCWPFTFSICMEHRSKLLYILWSHNLAEF